MLCRIGGYSFFCVLLVIGAVIFTKVKYERHQSEVRRKEKEQAEIERYNNSSKGQAEQAMKKAVKMKKQINYKERVVEAKLENCRKAYLSIREQVHNLPLQNQKNRVSTLNRYKDRMLSIECFQTLLNGMSERLGIGICEINIELEDITFWLNEGDLERERININKLLSSAQILLDCDFYYSADDPNWFVKYQNENEKLNEEIKNMKESHSNDYNWNDDEWQKICIDFNKIFSSRN